MEKYQLTSITDPMFDRAWEIYEASFPLIEQRVMDHQITAFASEQYYFDCFLEKGEIVGIACYWLFEEYLYIEHYAINPALRSGGYGSRILRELIESTSRIVILEIDEVVDETSTRRLQFYQRLGFHENPYHHPLPQYRDDAEHSDALLTILTYPRAIDEATYARFDRELREVVMKR